MPVCLLDRFLNVELLSQRVYAYMIFLQIVKFLSQRIVAFYILATNV